MKYGNFYNLTLNTADGGTVEVSLRLNLLAQKKLKAKYREDGGSMQTLIKAMDDPERLCDVLTGSLGWAGNENTVKDGETLYELLADNEMLGRVGTTEVLTSIARASGIVNDKEKTSIDSFFSKNFNELMGGSDGDAPAPTEGDAKNA